MKRVVTFIIVLLFVFQLTACKTSHNSLIQTDTQNLYKDDYLEACKLIADKYIYLEKKMNMTRDEFMTSCKDYANTVKWELGEQQFIDELRKLGAKFPDGHFEWYLSNKYDQEAMYLGLTQTISTDGKVIVGKVYKDFTDKVEVGDEIVKWNDKDILYEIKVLGNLDPQSSETATYELAARRLTLQIPDQPFRKKLEPVDLILIDKNSRIKKVHLDWKPCNLTSDFQKVLMEKKSNKIFIHKSGAASLEEIPEDVKFISPSLLYYIRIINSKKYAILHPRDFYHWSQQELDDTFQKIKQEKPNILVIDLKDTAGGAFNQVMYLAYALDVQRRFEFKYDAIDKNTGERIKGIDNFDFITDKIEFKNTWNGKVLFRINPLTKSGGDFFIRWMQLNKRGTIIGQPSAGAGGGTDSFELKNTKTVIYIPMRERQIIEDSNPIEGYPTIPDIYYDGSIEDYLSEIRD